MKNVLNYLKNLPSKAINSNLNAVEFILLSVVLLIAITISIYLVNPQLLA
jgi:hypothetical protein